MESPEQSVVWPTRTLGTSVMALRWPGGRTPILMPYARARGRDDMDVEGVGETSVMVIPESVTRSGSIALLPFQLQQHALSGGEPVVGRRIRFHFAGHR